MAFRMGITGLPNTGKSYAWKFYQGDDVFAILPSSKILHARKEDGTLLSKHPLKLNNQTLTEVAAKNKTTPYGVIKSIIDKNVSVDKIKPTGNFVQVSNVNHVADYKLFVSKYMPEIKIVLNPDFTHYISYIIQTNEFQRRKSGGEAFARLTYI